MLVVIMMLMGVIIYTTGGFGFRAINSKENNILLESWTTTRNDLRYHDSLRPTSTFFFVIVGMFVVCGIEIKSERNK